MGSFCKKTKELMQKIKAKMTANDAKSLIISTKEKAYFYENI